MFHILRQSLVDTFPRSVKHLVHLLSNYSNLLCIEIHLSSVTFIYLIGVPGPIPSFVDCPRVMTGSPGNITSPNYPDWYPNSYDCHWVITADQGYQVHLEFEYFEMTYTADCVGDYVEIIDGDSIENGTSKGKYCGYIMPMPKIVSKGNALLIRIHSDSTEPARGFHLKYSINGTGNLL